jgi:hypothetical protein
MNIFSPSVAEGAGFACPVITKWLFNLASHFPDNVLFPVPHRQYVLSIPKIFRRFILYDRKLRLVLEQIAERSAKS